MRAGGRWRKPLFTGLLSFSLIAGGSTVFAVAEVPSPAVQWEKDYGADVRLMNIQPSQDRGYTLMGTTKEGKVYLAETDEQGNQRWSNSFQLQAKYDSETEKQVTVSAIRHTQDGGYLLGGTVPGFHYRYNGYVVAKADKNGNVQWKEAYDSGAFGRFNMIQETKDGGSIDAVYTESLNAGSFHTAVEKRDGSGRKEWATVLGSGGPLSPNAEATSVQQTADGGYIAGGVKNNQFTLWKLNASGTVEWTKSYDYAQGQVVQAADGAYAFAASKAAGETVLVKTDASGSEQRKSTIGSGQAVSLMNTQDGGYLAGTSNSVVKTDAQGSVQWSKPLTGLTKAVPTMDNGAVILSSPATVVKLAGQTAPPIPQTGLKLDSEDYSLSVGQTLDTVLISVYGTHKLDVTRYGTYSTADPSIASVDKSGNIAGLKYGQTVLTATYQGMQTKANVYVYGGGGSEASSLKLDSQDYSMSAGNSSIDTVLTVVKDGKKMNVTGQGKYSIADASVATVNSAGVITGVKRGVTVLTAVYDGMKVTAKVYVY